MRDVRITCGDWTRVCGPSVVERHGRAAVFLDPPYSLAAGRKGDLYREDDLDVAHKAREWAIAAARNPRVRVAFAGYDGEHAFPTDWEVLRWKAAGGFGSQGSGTGRENSGRETLWFSPNCLRPA